MGAALRQPRLSLRLSLTRGKFDRCIAVDIPQLTTISVHWRHSLQFFFRYVLQDQSVAAHGYVPRRNGNPPFSQPKKTTHSDNELLLTILRLDNPLNLSQP